jgi:hypothetical protein
MASDAVAVLEHLADRRVDRCPVVEASDRPLRPLALQSHPAHEYESYRLGGWSTGAKRRPVRPTRGFETLVFIRVATTVTRSVAAWAGHENGAESKAPRATDPHPVRRHSHPQSLRIVIVFCVAEDVASYRLIP